MSDKHPSSELASKNIKYVDVFSGYEPSKGKPVTFVYCPDESGDREDIVLYAVGNHKHPGIYELGQELFDDLISKKYDQTKLGGGTISSRREVIDPSATYKKPIPDKSLDAFKNFLEDLDSKK